MLNRFLSAGRFSIRIKLILLLSFIMLTGLAVTNYIYYKASLTTVRSSLVEGILPLTRDNIYSEIQTNLLKPVFLSSLMANDTFLKDWAITGEMNTSRMTTYLKTIRDKYDFFSTFFISDTTRRYYHHTGVTKIISSTDKHDQWYFNFIKSGRDYELDVDTNEAENNTLTIFINHRVTDKRKKLLGVTGVGLKLNRISALFRSYKDIYGCVVYLVNTSGIIQAHPNEKLTEKGDIHKLKGIREIAETVLNTKSSTSIYDFTRDSEHLYLSVRYIPEFNWFLFVEVDENSRMRIVRKHIMINLLLGIMLTAAVIAISVFVINYFQRRLEHMSATDELTGANNRREFDLQFRKSVYDFNRSGTPFSLILFDIDSFKSINDTMGHITGDSSIKTVATIARNCMRLTDILVRWGGDEFIILTHGDVDSAMMAAERIRKQVEESEFFQKRDEHYKNRYDLTISCGVSGFRNGDTLDTILARVDAALYRAKSEGRNRIVKEQ